MNRPPENNGDNEKTVDFGQTAASLEEKLNQAVEHHRAGRLFEAEEIPSPFVSRRWKREIPACENRHSQYGNRPFKDY
jgi:hypothetical protein